ncbi:hypothetical protein BC941DRAFT_501794 [Chlamydoabsidia padenii]|nr:hypothetical protein BC941DRAFT_501794 [Chlamydoabsidia padenii]
MNDLHTNLPTLQQVLSRKTLPPLCLYNYYVVMRDRLHMEQVLDFYLDVQHHEQLWRQYLRSIQKTSHLNDTSYYRLQALDESARRIHMRYLVPCAAKDLTQYLPIKLVNTIPTRLNDPGVFSEAKQYLFRLMQRQAYPKFLRVKGWGNLTLWQQVGRLVIGLVALLVGLTTGLSLILLGYPPWGIRCWVILPFWIGVFHVLVFLTGVDPLWVLLFNISETTTFCFNKIKHPQVKRILWSRSIWLLATSVVVAVLLTVIFCVLPPKRL